MVIVGAKPIHIGDINEFQYHVYNYIKNIHGNTARGYMLFCVINIMNVSVLTARAKLSKVLIPGGPKKRPELCVL